MRKSSIPLLACLVCLILASTLSAQDEATVVTPEKVIRLVSPNLPPEVDRQAYLSSGQIMVTGGFVAEAAAVVPGPAPAPYPQPVIWEKGIEQLGPTSVKCDGMWFINGNVWQPNKIALIQWKIRIPQAFMRLASEFERDLTLALWVDTNEDKTWGASERVLRESINLHSYFPNNYSYVEVLYLTSFTCPSTPAYKPASGSGAGGATKYEAKLWARGGVSYDDLDVSPVGQFLFGEVEDYLVTYFEIRYGTKVKG